MALELKLSYVQSKDAKQLIFTDISGVYDPNNLTGWGFPNPEVATIDGVTHTLTLDVIKKGIDDNDTTYDTIDLYTLFGPFTTINDLVFTLNASHFVSNGAAMGNADSQIPDGVYQFTYKYDKGLGSEVTLVGTLLLNTIVKNSIDKLISEIPDVYNCINYKSPKIDFALLAYGYLQSMESAAYLAKIDDLLKILDTLQDIIRNGNNSIR